ncbi:hypothetical protein QFZ99_004235 [Paraburkholderia atlantica]
MKKPESLPGGRFDAPRNVANLAADCATGRHDADAPRQGQAATMTGASNNGTSMKIRLLSVACLASAAALLAACTIVTRNSNACEQLMRSKLAEPSSGMSSDRLRVTHRGAAIRGSRVVVEGTIEHVGSASATAASAPLAASASQAASEVEVAAKAGPAAEGPHAGRRRVHIPWRTARRVPLARAASAGHAGCRTGQRIGLSSRRRPAPLLRI